MREVQVFFWRVPALGKRKAYVSSVPLTHQEAVQRYGPGVVQEPGPGQLRKELEGDELSQVMQSAGRDGARG
jgi:hypothetical protein